MASEKNSPDKNLYADPADVDWLAAAWKKLKQDPIDCAEQTSLTWHAVELRKLGNKTFGLCTIANCKQLSSKVPGMRIAIGTRQG